MVYAAGNYNTTEFAISGTPFQAWLVIVAAFILHFRQDWRIIWIVGFVTVGGIIFLALVWAALPKVVTQPIEDALLNIEARIGRQLRKLSPAQLRKRFANASGKPLNAVSSSQHAVGTRPSDASGSGLPATSSDGVSGSDHPVESRRI